MTWPFSSLLR